MNAFGDSRRLRNFMLAVVALVLCFAVPFWDLVRFAATSQFHSYILLIPFTSAFLIWVKQPNLAMNSRPVRGVGGVLISAGAAIVLVYWLVFHSRWKPVEDDYLALMMGAFLLCFLGICWLFWDQDTLRAVAFPLGLLIFLAPIPTFAVPAIDSFLQNGSAAAAQGFFSLSGTPLLREGLAFHLPGITLQIAPECSGIQSSVVLLITGLMAAYLFLRTSWTRALMVLFVIVLGLIRNGFRVFVIGELCVHFGPQMVNSYIHRQGGPIFFALSLIPLLIMLVVLQKLERKRAKNRTPNL